MDYFYIIVISVAIAILIILLTFVGISLRKKSVSSQGGVWPPFESNCPDYWQIDSTDSNYCLIPGYDKTNNKPPRNAAGIYNSDGTLNLTSTNTPGLDSANNRIKFTDPYYSACNKQKWANPKGIFWDGYSNYNGKC